LFKRQVAYTRLRCWHLDCFCRADLRRYI